MDEYTEKVRQQVEKLRTCSYREIETAVAKKRTTWCQAHAAQVENLSLTPREAFEMLFFQYMGLSAQDLPILHESDESITWLSRNPCPTLDACLQLGLDTRQVCRAAYEKSTQVFLSQIDPRLRFLRSYREIRPYSDHCLESIIKVNFEEMMQMALEEARTSRQEGNKGYGAVIALGRQVLARAHDTAAVESDPSLHAEVNAIRAAIKVTGDPNLSGAILFSTCEPCPMCASLAVWANLTSIVYGASIEETARLGKARIRVGVQEIVDRSPVMIEVIGGVLQEECLKLYR